MRVLLIALAIALAAALPDAARADGIGVAPIIVNLSPQRSVGAFTLRNGRDSEVSFAVEVYAWRQADGQDVLTPTHDVVAAPSVFLTPPRGEQIVRVALLPQARDASRELSYRLVLRELPPAAPQNGFRLLLEMSLPVFATPRGARGMLDVRQTSEGVLLANTGDAHLALAPAPGGAGIVNPPRYLLAGAQALRRAAPGARMVNLAVATPGDIAATTRNFPLTDAPARLADVR